VEHSSTAEVFDALSERAKQNKSEQHARRMRQIDALRESGFQVQQFTEYHYRINGRLDLWTTWGKWHDVKKNIRGRCQGTSLVAFVKQFFATRKEL
jgi:hypothetical protein